jgi:hypothetical protein
MSPLVDSFDKIIYRQQGIATRAQLLLAGVDDMTMYRRTRRREWQRPLPAVYALTSNGISTEQRRIAAWLYAGPTAQMTGLAALAWYGFQTVPTTDRIHLLVPHETRRRSVGFAQIHRTYALDLRPREAELYTLVSPPRAVIDACRASSDLTMIRAIMAEAVTSRGVGIGALDSEIRRAQRSRTALARRVLHEILAGIRSAPEADLRELVGTSKIVPAVLWNPRLTTADGEPLPTPDGYIPDAGIAVEVDSREHHSSDADWARTLRRHNLLSELGVLVLHYTPREIRSERARVLRSIERSYQVRIQSPPVVAVLVGAPSSTANVNTVPFLAEHQ